MAARITDQGWRERAKTLLKGEIRRRQMSYQDLVDRLAEMGVHETTLNIANKLARGRFSAVFMLQCLAAIGCRQIRLHFEDED